MSNKFTVLGLPGVGKSTTAKMLAEKLGLEVVSTDALFRIFRSDATHPITLKFVDEMKEKGIEIDTSKIADGKEFRNVYGEVVFRDYEDIMIAWLDENGELEGKIPDFSASFYLREGNREFLKNNGYLTVFLNGSDEKIFEHIVKDWHTFKETSKPIRGNYEKVGLEAEAKGRNPIEAIEAFSMDNKEIRYPFYSKADVVLNLTGEETPEEIADMVMKKLNES